jgi:hypothetical protein
MYSNFEAKRGDKAEGCRLKAEGIYDLRFTIYESFGYINVNGHPGTLNPSPMRHNRRVIPHFSGEPCLLPRIPRILRFNPPPVAQVSPCE